MIHFLSSDAFSGQLPAPNEKGVSPIFRAKIRINDEPARCYVKPLPDKIFCPVTGSIVTNQEVINEALGYVLAKSSGLTVADAAGIILLTREQIPSYLHSELINAGNGTPQENYFCWFSRDMEYPNLNQKHLRGVSHPAIIKKREKRLALRLAENPESAVVIALDDWLLNSDRHAGNLLESSKGSLLLIDHGRILKFPNWTPGSLGSAPWLCENRLMRLINDHVDRWSELLPNSSARAIAYKGFAVSFRRDGADAARKVLLDFFSQVDVDAIISLLDDRLNPEPHAKASGLLNL